MAGPRLARGKSATVCVRSWPRGHVRAAVTTDLVEPPSPRRTPLACCLGSVGRWTNAPFSHGSGLFRRLHLPGDGAGRVLEPTRVRHVARQALADLHHGEHAAHLDGTEGTGARHHR